MSTCSLDPKSRSWFTILMIVSIIYDIYLQSSFIKDIPYPIFWHCNDNGTICIWILVVYISAI